MKNILILLFLPILVLGKPPEVTNAILKTPPPKIIRTCCSFGHELKLFGLSFIRFTDVTSIEKLGRHRYLGSKSENNGIIYTYKGGFVDVAHTRDVADWTAYIYLLIQKTKESGNPVFEMELGKEGGKKSLALYIPSDFSNENTIRLAGKIAYDLSVWHEIATWYGNSYIPVVKERYSAFSVEDTYSNLLGSHVGMEAIRSELPYEDAVTLILNQKLNNLTPVANEEETIDAMHMVKEIWWTDKAYMPSGKVLLKREFTVFADSIMPRLVPELSHFSPSHLSVPFTTESSEDLSLFYEIRISLNHKFQVKKIFGRSKGESEDERLITQKDFNTLIYEGNSKNRKKFPIDKYSFD